MCIIVLATAGCHIFMAKLYVAASANMRFPVCETGTDIRVNQYVHGINEYVKFIGAKGIIR